VIYSYNKSQPDALFLKFIFIKNSTRFGQIYCSTLTSLADSQHNYCCVYGVETPDDGQ